MNAELPPFKYGEHSESAFNIGRVITPLSASFVAGQVENARRGSLARQRSLSSDEVPLRNQPVSDGSIEERHEGPKKVAAYVGSGVAELPVSFRDYRTMPQEAVLYPVTSNMSKSDDGEQSGVSHLSADSPDQQSTGD